MGPVRLPSSDGVELEVFDLGGDGPPLLLCHATGFHATVLDPLGSALGDGWHRWSLDFRAHGTSSRPEGGRLAWPAFGEDVLAVVDGLGLEAARGFGHSMGGAALLLAEQARPGTFAGLYLFEPIVFPPRPAHQDGGEPGGSSLAEGAKRRRAVFDSRDAAYDNFARKPPLSVLTPEALRAYVDHGFADQPDGTVALRCRPEDESAVYAGGGGHGAFGHLGEVVCPVTVANGAHTDLPPEAFPAQVAALADGRAEVFADLGHFGPLQDPPGVAASVRQALATG